MKTKKEKYFFPPPSPQDDARVAKADLFIKHEPTWYYLANTFFGAAKHIIVEMKDETTFFIWPAMVLFRQSIELMLKAILCKVGLTVRKASASRHDIGRLIGQVLQNKHLLAVRLASADERFLRDSIAELHALDRKGDAFRYAMSEKGERYWRRWPESLNTAQLVANMDRLFYTLRDLHGFPEEE